jgi:hypothetical protein
MNEFWLTSLRHFGPLLLSVEVQGGLVRKPVVQAEAEAGDPEKSPLTAKVQEDALVEFVIREKPGA